MKLRSSYAALAGLLLFVNWASSQNTSIGASHFRWSERLAHELDYNHTIATAKELSPQERRELLAFVLQRFNHPVSERYESMFEDMTDRQLRKLASDTRIEMSDLNSDGMPEIIAQGNGFGPCGATGNCIVLVMQRSPDGFRLLFDSYAGSDGGGFEKIRILDASTNGYRDIVVAAHDSACERTASVLTYEKKEYRERECYQIRRCTVGGTRLAKPKIEAC